MPKNIKPWCRLCARNDQEDFEVIHAHYNVIGDLEITVKCICGHEFTPSPTTQTMHLRGYKAAVDKAAERRKLDRTGYSRY